MKKGFSVFFIFLAVLMTMGILFSFSNKTNISAKVNADEILTTQSKSAILIDADSGTVIYSLNENNRLPIASMCKIMTLLLSFEEIDKGNLSFDEEITVSNTASGMGGSQVFLEEGAKYKVEELLKSITVASANDACVAMAERIAGSEDLFVDMMNKKVNELQMNNTVFVNCTGLPKAGQYSCALDVSKMFSELLKHKEYFKFSNIWMDKISHPNNRKTEISNTNKLIKFYKGCDAGKTGFTSEAGHCLSASAYRDGLRLISVVICSPNSKTRFNEVSQMFNYGFKNFTNKTVVDSNKELDIPVKIEGGKKELLSIIAESDVKLFSSKNEKKSVNIEFIPFETVKAPVNKGEVIGKISIYENNVEIASVRVLANETVESKTYFNRIADIIGNWSII